VTRGGAPRWALSFADLCLLLLGFFVILHAQSADPARVASGMRSAFGDGAASSTTRFERRAAALFQPGEAILRPDAAARLRSLGARAGASGKVLIVSTGTDASTRRLDAWELAAARTAAIARAIRGGGVDEARVTVAIPAMDGAQSGKGQTISVTVRN